MSSRYDTRTTTFSPEGRLYQVEYAVEAISQAGTALGIITAEGIVLAAQRRHGIVANATGVGAVGGTTSPAPSGTGGINSSVGGSTGNVPSSNDLLDSENLPARNISGEKLFKVARHVGVAVAGITSDATTLLQYLRLTAHRHEYQYQQLHLPPSFPAFTNDPSAIGGEDENSAEGNNTQRLQRLQLQQLQQHVIPVEHLCRVLCDVKQGYTQYGGVRPFGVAFLIAGCDPFFGYQLYFTDPSGNYSSWDAYAIGESDAAALSLLKLHWNKGMTLRQGLLLAIKVLQKTMDVTNLTPDKIEMATLSTLGKNNIFNASSNSSDPNTVIAPRHEVHQLLSQDRILNPAVAGGLPPVTLHTPGVAALDDVASSDKGGILKFTILTAEELKPLIEEAEKERQKEEEEKERKEAEMGSD